MKIDECKEFEHCLSLAKNAKDLREAADKAERRSTEEFRSLRIKFVHNLKEEKEELMQTKITLQAEYLQIASDFCKQKGKHTTQHENQEKEEVLGYNFFSRGKFVNKIYYPCIICGFTEDYRFKNNSKPYKTGSEEIIKNATIQTENLELQKIAIRILQIKEELDNIDEKILEKQTELERICKLFGHDAKKINVYSDEFKCKCCDKVMSQEEYSDSCKNALYKFEFV